MNLEHAELYRLLAVPFHFPDRVSALQLQQGVWGGRMNQVLHNLHLENPFEASLKLDTDFDCYESEFIGLHEVGLGGAPCPLHSGHYARDRMKTLEEVVRFYQFFHYEPDRSVDRLQDHIVFELGFVAHLIEIEMATAESGDIESPRRARQDFVDRHLISWLPQLCTGLDKRAEIPFVKEAAHIAHWFVLQDRELLFDKELVG